MIRNLVGILFLFWVFVAHSQSINKIISGDTTYSYTDKDYELILAASQGDTAKLCAFLEIGADVNTTTYEGATPLMFAAQNGHLRSVEILIDSGAKVNIKPYHNIDALLGACIAGHVTVADTLILNGANVNTHNLEGLTPLMYAAAFNYPVLADMLLFYKAKVNVADYDGNTALILSTFYDNIDVSDILIKQSATIDNADVKGFTPLLIAAQNGYLQHLEFLLENGADIKKTNNNNLDALSVAILNKQDHIVEYLFNYGINVNHSITDKMSQYDLAKLYGSKEMVEVLGHAGAKSIMKLRVGKLYVNPAMVFNTRDIMMGVHAGIIESKFGIELELGYKTRPWVRSVLYEVNENTFYQFWEKRSIFHVGIDKCFQLKNIHYYENLGLYAGVNFGYSYGNFRGSNNKPDDGGLIIPKAGLFYNYKAFNLKISYEYMKFNNSSVSPHRIGFSFGLMINLLKNRLQLKEEPVL